MTRQYDKTDGWYGADDLGGGIWRISDHGSDNMILVLGQERALLFDTGYGAGDLPGFLSGITKLPLTVVLSHGHLDHACGNDWFDEVYGGAFDLSRLNESGVPAMRAAQRGEAHDAITGMWGGCARVRHIPVSDGMRLELGGRTLTCVLTPGHTPGGVCLYDPQTETLLTGDTYVPLDYWNEMWLQLEDSRPLSEYLAGLRKLQQFDAKWLLSGHGECGRLPISRLTSYLELLEDILSGRETGAPIDTIAGSGLVCHRDGSGIVYRADRL